MTITRGQMQRNLYNQGGIMDAVPREGYFLGKLAKGLKKGVKKIGKGVKKFAKSDLGKAAMLAAGAYFMPGIGIKASGGLGSFLGNLGSKASTAGNFLKSKGADFLRKPKNVEMLLSDDKSRYLPTRLDDFEISGGYAKPTGGKNIDVFSRLLSGKEKNEGGIKSVLADFFQDEKKRNILSDVLKGATSIAGGKMAYDDQKRINEARQKEYDDYVARRSAVSSQLEDVVPELDIRMANGGRVNYNDGGTTMMASMEENELEFMRLVDEFMEAGFNLEEAIEAARDELGRKSLAMGGMPTGIMRTNEAGTIERDYREMGGFVPPIGIKEKADDIPAMLSNNEFVMTADSVRGIGDGSVKKGAKKLYALMRESEGKGRA
jgi:hypothetical protein